jgi:MFS family permease
MIRLVLAARALRGFADGCISVVLPAYLLALGHGELEVGLISTATLFGSAFTTLAIGRWGNRFPVRRLMLAAALLMAATGAAFAGFSSLWPLLVVGFAGTLNPSSGDASVFMPLDHTMLATAPAEQRTALFARYSFIGSVFGALGALAAGAPEWLAAAGWSMLDALRAMFLLYGAIGAGVWLLYRGLPEPRVEQQGPPAALGPSRGIVLPSPAAWCSTHCSRSGCSSASA